MRIVASLFVLSLLAACAESPEDAANKQVAEIQRQAEKDNPQAQFQLAQMLRTGDGIPKDLPQAVEWYRKDADQGMPDAQHNLGVAFDNGQGVKENDAEAAQWYRRAAEQGRPNAQYGLARLLLFGKGVEHDPPAAARWLRIAAQAKHVDSIYNLGLMNRDGLGMPTNSLMAGKWLILSAKLGKLEAQGAYHILASDLSPEQRTLAERLAEEEQTLLNRPAPLPLGLLAPLQGRLIRKDSSVPYTGRALLNHPNGARAREIELKEGLPHGWELTWFPDDRLAGRTQFKDGLRDGIVEEWYLNGQMRLQGTNQTHRLMQAISFSVDGNATGQVKDGNGTLVIHHLNGQRAEEHVFVEGNRTTTRRWDAKGTELKSSSKD